MDTKTLIGILPVIISTINFALYMYSVYFGKTRPHLFSWLIWGIVAAIAAAGQYVEGAGSGGWISIAISVYSFIRVIACITHGEKKITRSDWACLFACLIAIVIWVLLKDPMISVILVSLIDAVGIIPTARKSWMKPEQENAFSYFLFGVTSFLGLIALENYNVTTIFYPATVTIICWGFYAFLLIRKKQLKDLEEGI